jgi:hypothetical protein
MNVRLIDDIKAGKQYDEKMAKLKYLGMTETNLSTCRAEKFGKCLLLFG